MPMVSRCQECLINYLRTQEITSICTLWSSDFHLEVDDLYGITFFNKSLDLVDTKYGQPDSERFTDLL
jgi:hypothetical protein